MAHQDKHDSPLGYSAHDVASPAPEAEWSLYTTESGAFDTQTGTVCLPLPEKAVTDSGIPACETLAKH